MKTTATLLAALLLTLTGCTDAQFENLATIGSAAEVTCYSGGVVIYEGKSTGKVATTHGSDGWEFKDAKTGKFVRVSGDCVVSN